MCTVFMTPIAVLQLLANATEDSALITLEALHQIVKIDTNEAIPHMHFVLEQVMPWQMFPFFLCCAVYIHV